MTIEKQTNLCKPVKKDTKSGFNFSGTNQKAVRAWMTFARAARYAKPSVRESDQ